MPLCILCWPMLKTNDQTFRLIKNICFKIKHTSIYEYKSSYPTALAPQAEGWVFESQPRQTKVVETGSDSSTAKHFNRCEWHVSSEMTIINVPCHSRCIVSSHGNGFCIASSYTTAKNGERIVHFGRGLRRCSSCGTLKNPHRSMTMSAVHRSSPVMVTSTYEWEILELDDKQQTTNLFVSWVLSLLVESITKKQE